jgi:large subunit ribosomal protein L24
MNKLKVGDEVIVLSGKYKKKRGTIEKVINSSDSVIVTNVNMVKKHLGPRRRGGEKGEIIEVSAPIKRSKVALCHPEKNKPSRVGFKIDSNGNKNRYFKIDDSIIESK